MTEIWRQRDTKIKKNIIFRPLNVHWTAQYKILQIDE